MEPLREENRPAPAGNRLSLAVPAYVHPAEDPDTWVRLARLGNVARFVVVNVDSGPGPADDPYYPRVVEALSAGGVRTIGYVDTAYGERSPAEVLTDVEAWIDRYRLPGVFFDRVPSQLRHLDDVDHLTVAARSRGTRFIVLNPGTFPHPGFVDLANVTVTFEGSWGSYQALREPDWAARYAPSRFAHLVHAVPEPAERSLHQAVQLARTRRVGSFFATTRSGPHPWSQLPLPLVDAVVGMAGW